MDIEQVEFTISDRQQIGEITDFNEALKRAKYRVLMNENVSELKKLIQIGSIPSRYSIELSQDMGESEDFVKEKKYKLTGLKKSFHSSVKLEHKVKVFQSIIVAILFKHDGLHKVN